MGKAALILVAAVSLGAGFVYQRQNDTIRATVFAESRYQHGVLAREIAQSSFNIVESRARRDFDNYRVSSNREGHFGGYRDFAAITSGSDVVVSATGEFGGATHTITGTLRRGGGSVLDAITIDGPVKKVEMKDDAVVSGLDTNPDGTDGTNTDVHAVRSILASAHDEVVDEVEAGVAVGVAGLDDFVQGSTEVDLAALVQAIKDYSGAYLTEYAGDTKLKNETIGSQASPRLVRINGKAELEKTFRGYGILFVTGDLKMEDTARWDGLIIAAADDGKFEVKDEARIYGALVVSATSEDGPGGDTGGGGGLPDGHFDVDVFEDGSKIYHEHQYDDDYDVTGVDLLTAGCKNGGLCWQEVLGSETDVHVEFFNEENSMGTYSIEAGSVSLSGDPFNGLSMVALNASQVTNFSVEFDALCHLIESNPGQVQSDANNRNGAFSVRIYRDSGGNPGDLAYELSVYHHTNTDFPCAADGGGETADASAYGDPLEIKVKDDAVVQYSAQALSNALSLVSGFSLESGGIVLVNVAATQDRSATPTG